MEFGALGDAVDLLLGLFLHDHVAEIEQNRIAARCLLHLFAHLLRYVNESHLRDTGGWIAQE